MAIMNMETVELIGLAVVKVRRTMELPAAQVKEILANDENIGALLAEDLACEVNEWNLLLGVRKAPSVINAVDGNK